jgi:antitoxin component YwqK of YwqJK toxin-antitoxin module
MRSTLILLPAFLLLVACQPAPDWEKDAERAAKSKSGKLEAPAIDTIKTEKRADGLVYEVGKDTPYTGRDVEPQNAKDPSQERTGYVVVTPYLNGKIHGAKETYFPSGRLREARIYDNGVAKESTVYFSSGKKKLYAKLNAKDVAEGEYKRWHENGQLHTEGAHDADERFQGEFKEWNENGELTGHYLWEHGKLLKAIFETPAQKEDRLKSYGKLEGEP